MEGNSKKIYLNKEDDISSVLDRILDAEEKSIDIFIPEGSRILESSINLRFLSQEAGNSGKEVRFITADYRAKNFEDCLVYDSEYAKNNPPQEQENPKEQEERFDSKETAEDYTSKPISELDTESEEHLLSDYPKKEDKLFKIELTSSSYGEGERHPIKMADIIRRPKEIDLRPQKREADERLYFEDSVLKTKKIKKQKNSELLNKFKKRLEKIPTLKNNKGSFKNGFHVFPKFLSGRFFNSLIVNKFFIIFLSLGILVGMGTLYLVLPNAKVIAYLKKETVNFDLDILASQDVSATEFDKNIIPAETIIKEAAAEEEFDATGIKVIEENSRGRIKVYNAYSSSPQILVKTTRFISESGKLFRLDDTITVPGAKIEEGKIVPSYLWTNITADEVGEDFNIGPSKFTIPGFKGTAKYVGFYGVSEESTAGGFKGQAKTPTKDDISSGKNKILDELRNKIAADIKNSVPEGLNLLDGVLKIDEKNFSTNVLAGEKADKFKIELSLKGRAILFRESDIRSLIENFIKKDIKNNDIYISDLNFNYNSVTPDFVSGNLKISLDVAGSLSWKLDDDKLVDSIRGKRQNELKDILKDFGGVDKVQVTLWPFWVKSVPDDKGKIEIEIKEGVVQ